MKKFIYSFNETHNEGKETLGGKGANLAEMTRLGLPIPQGFTITTRCCMDYLADATFFEEHLQSEILKAVKNLETETGKSFTADNEILLVSVRSGAAFSMPGRRGDEPGRALTIAASSPRGNAPTWCWRR